jgi:hypothetical protein
MAMTGDSTIVLDLRIAVPVEKRSDLLAFLRKAIPFYERPGGIRVRLLQSQADPTRMIERVEYANHAIFEQDQRRVAEDPEMRRYLEEWRTLLDTPPEVEVYREVPAGAAFASAQDLPAR